MSTTTNQVYRPHWRELIRPVGSHFPETVAHGFSTKRATQSEFLEPFHVEGYWRDVTSRSAMEDRFNNYFEAIPLDVNQDAIERAFLRVKTLFLKHYGCDNHVSSVFEAWDVLPKSTSAGLPFQSGVRKGTVSSQMLRFAKLSWRNVNCGKKMLSSPCIAGARRVVRLKGENKPRLVWAYPGYINVIESQFTKMFMERKPPFIGWYYNWFDYGVSLDRFQQRVEKGFAWMNLDFSSFDSTVPSFLIRMAFDIVKSMYDLTTVEENMFKDLIYYFIHTPIVMYNTVRYKHRGIPSGSAFTQLIGSIVNMLACHYACELFSDVDILSEECSWLGDDSCLVFLYHLNSSFMKNEFLKTFSDLGLTVNQDKTLFSLKNGNVKFKYLGKEKFRFSRSWLVDIEKLAVQATFPEFTDRYPEDAIQRLFGLMWTYGVDDEAYKLLLRMYLHVIKTFGHVNIGDKESHSMVRFLMLGGLSPKDIQKLPLQREIISRQYGHFRPLRPSNFII